MQDRSITRALLPVLLLVSWLSNPQPSSAHPMGNFSISHYSHLRVELGYIELRYLIDVAEIPTYQEIQETGIVPREGDPGLAQYLSQKAELLARGLALEVNGQRRRLQMVTSSVIFPDGAGGLPTMSKARP